MKDEILFIILLVLSFGFYAWLYKWWSEKHEKRIIDKHEMETEFDYNLFDDENKKIFGDLF